MIFERRANGLQLALTAFVNNEDCGERPAGLRLGRGLSAGIEGTRGVTRLPLDSGTVFNAMLEVLGGLEGDLLRGRSLSSPSSEAARLRLEESLLLLKNGSMFSASIPKGFLLPVTAPETR